MAHTLTARPSVTAQTTVEVSPEVAEEVEGLFAYLTEHPNQEGYGEFDTEAEKLDFLRQARAYAAGRDAGALKLRVLPSKKLPNTALRFSLKRDLEANSTEA